MKKLFKNPEKIRNNLSNYFRLDPFEVSKNVTNSSGADIASTKISTTTPVEPNIDFSVISLRINLSNLFVKIETLFLIPSTMRTTINTKLS